MPYILTIAFSFNAFHVQLIQYLLEAKLARAELMQKGVFYVHLYMYPYRIRFSPHVHSFSFFILKTSNL